MEREKSKVGEGEQSFRFQTKKIKTVENDYRTILEEANDAILIIEIETGKILYANKKVTELYGFSRDKIGIFQIKDICLNESPYIQAEAMVRVNKAVSGEPQIFEWKARHKNGHSFWCEVSFKRAEFIGKQCLIAVARDISHLKDIEKQLKESEKKYRTIFESSSAAIAIISEDATINLVNTEFEDLVGCSRTDLENKKKWSQLIHPDDIDRVKAYHNKRLTDPENAPRNYEIRIISCNGTEKNVYVTAANIPEIPKTVVSMIDITRQRKVNEELRLASEAIANANEGIVITCQSGKIISTNPAFEVITGYNCAEVKGCYFDQFFYSEEPDCTDKIPVFDFTSGETGRGQILGKRKNEEVYRASFSVNPVFSEQGCMINYVIIIYDITEIIRIKQERQKLKEYTERTQRLASLNTLSAGIIHEIAQPLNAITLLADSNLYWAEEKNNVDPQEALEAFRQILVQARRIDDIICHVRDFAGAGKSTEVEPCNLNIAVEGALDMMGSQLYAHGITLKTNPAFKLIPVMANFHRIEEVVINLVANAIQALDTVDKQYKEICCTTMMEDSRVILEVSDNGPGMNGEIIENLFNPLFTTKGEEIGMGLGLTIVHSIVTSYKGRIEAQNNERGGACFRIEFETGECF